MILQAHNLLAALVDNHLHWHKAPHLDTNHISWGRVADMSDRALRHVAVGLGFGQKDGVPRQVYNSSAIHARNNM